MDYIFSFLMGWLRIHPTHVLRTNIYLNRKRFSVRLNFFHEESNISAFLEGASVYDNPLESIRFSVWIGEPDMISFYALSSFVYTYEDMHGKGIVCASQ
jgi:hypothetical protein